MDGLTRFPSRSDVLVMAVAARPAPVREILETGGGQAVGTRDGGAVLCLFRTGAQAGAAVDRDG